MATAAVTFATGARTAVADMSGDAAPCHGVDLYRVSSEQRARCGARTHPLLAITTDARGGHEYHYQVNETEITMRTPPSAFDPVTASQREREEYGIPPEPPMREHAAHARWEAELHNFHPASAPAALYVPSAEAENEGAALELQSNAYTTGRPETRGEPLGLGGPVATNGVEGSTNWGGEVNYLTSAGNESTLDWVQATRMVYREPTLLSDCEGQQASFWTGIAGWRQNASEPLDQAGTELGTNGDIGDNEAWIENFESNSQGETLPDGSPEPVYKSIGMPYVATAGAEFEVAVSHVADNKWEARFYNFATGEASPVIEQKESTKPFIGSSADFIVESQAWREGHSIPLSDFGSWEVLETWEHIEIPVKHEGGFEPHEEGLYVDEGTTALTSAPEFGSAEAETAPPFSVKWLSHGAPGCTPEDPSPAPHVETGDAPSVVTAGQATLQGQVNPNGLETHYDFEYGTTTSYGSTSTVESAGSGVVPESVKANINGLRSGTLYHYRLAAYNGDGTSYGADRTFKTRGWVVQSTSDPSRSDDELSGVSCWELSGCIAVGTYVNEMEARPDPLVERWNGSTWNEQTAPRVAGASETALQSVSCVSTSDCMAVGHYESGELVYALAEQWNGTTWAVQNATTEHGAWLESVSCVPNTKECIAVGGVTTREPNGSHVLIERWNGRRWRAERLKLRPGEGEYPWLYGVSCPAVRECKAVGSIVNSTQGQRPLVISLSGLKWRIQASPTPEPEYYGYLTGVSCATASACTGVGRYASSVLDGTQSLIERWEGSAWTIERSPSPVGKEKAEGETHWDLSSVSCAEAQECVALGAYGERGSVSELLGEYWSGSTWELVEPVSEGLTISRLFVGLPGLSCPVVEFCTAVGASISKSEDIGALAERLEPPTL